jgi:CheY-like chemotaxis protein
MAKILLVEDDPSIYKMYQKAFELEGFETEIAENGQEGLDKVGAFKPDIILLDIMMPTMNGIDMLNQLRADEATKDTPVIVLTNVADIRIANEAFAKGANLSIVKSETEPDQVISWINSVLSKTAAATDQTDDDKDTEDE